MKLEEMKKSLRISENVFLGSIWEKISILPPGLHILVIQFFNLFQKISLELAVTEVLAISDPHID